MAPGGGLVYIGVGDKYGRVINATSRPLYPRERDPVYIVHEAGLASRLIWTGTE